MNDHQQVVDQVRDSSRRSLHCKAKRTPEMAACIHCNKAHVINDRIISFICPHCNKYQNADEARKKYESGDYIHNETNQAPASGIKSDYIKLRDEFEIRADLFASGKSRETMGVNKFSNLLRRELIKNKCYRGLEGSGV
jgi:predicted RNA-binding Zn-ribbon protein involved in translation (DUF1610 family)